MKTLPCPHCGKQPALFQNEDYGPGGPIPTDWTIQCCAVMTASTKDNVIAFWNKRVNCTKITMKLPKMTKEQNHLWCAIKVYEHIRENPGCTMVLGSDYATATELEAIGLVVSETHDDGEDTWRVCDE